MWNWGVEMDGMKLVGGGEVELGGGDGLEL